MKKITHRWECTTESKRWRIFLHFVGWGTIQLGVSVDFKNMNAQLYIPFCFIGIGYWHTLEVEYTKSETGRE